MAKATMDLEIAVKAAVVRPGDAIILLTHNPLSAQERYDLTQAVQAKVPHAHVVVIDGIDQALVYKPAEPNDAGPPCGRCGRPAFWHDSGVWACGCDPETPSLRPPSRPNPSDPRTPR